jgi:Large polyvalent protein associated domain 29
MVMKNERNMSTHALAAKMIRQELKKLFPNTKFSVTSKEHAVATAVDVDWFDGPNIPIIEGVIEKYTKGNSDGKINGFPQVKYASTRRDITMPLCEKAFKLIRGIDPVLAHSESLHSGMTADQIFQTDGPTPYRYIMTRIREMDLTNGFKVEDYKQLIENKSIN